MASPLRIKRGTRAQINAAKAANSLAAGEPYLVTDEGGRLELGTAANASTSMATKDEVDAKADSAAPTFTGLVTVPTPGKSSAANTAASTAFVKWSFASASISGVLDWNDVSNTTPGVGATLLLGTAANGPGGGYHYPLNFAYAGINATSNTTQFAVGYSTNTLAMRWRYSGVWSQWTYFARTDGVGATGTWPISVTGSAAALATTRTIGGVSFNGTANINLPGVNAAGNQNTTGSAAALTTARNINGTAFNGTANITTASWGTARTLTIGSTGKSVDGSGAVSWSLAEIGAQAELVSGSNIKTINGMALPGAGNLLITGEGTAFAMVPYASRGDLRSQSATNGGLVLVEGLGLFRYVAGSDEPDEPDDDESCFATASGRWLLQAAHWDLVDAWSSVEAEDREAASEAASYGACVLHATFASSVTSVAANTNTTAAVAVPGAQPGDAVLVTRSGPAATKPEGVVFGTVSAPGTVTVQYAAGSALSYFAAGPWRVTVMREI